MLTNKKKKSIGNSWESKPNPKPKRTEPNRAQTPTKLRKNVPMQNEFQLQSAREKFIKKPSGGNCPLLNVFFIFRVFIVVFPSLFREKLKTHNCSVFHFVSWNAHSHTLAKMK